MEDVGGNSSASPKNEKPVVVRVKRKAHQSPLEAFWLEIYERPLKRPLLDFQKLSISDTAAKVEELKIKKVFVRHVETVSSSKFCSDALQPYIHTEWVGGSESKQKIEERRHNLKTENKQQKLLVKAKQKQEILSKNARFEQIWRSRKGKKELSGEDHDLHEECHIYDIIRIDAEETSKKSREQEDEELEDYRIMASYLPLLREFIPSAAAELESNIHDYVPKRASDEGYVYDLYTVKDDINIEEDASNPFPLVQVNEDDEFYDGPSELEHDSDDSNAEDNPLNDYPDEELSEDDGLDDSGSRTTENESEEVDYSEGGTIESSPEALETEHLNWSRKVDPLYDGDFYCDDYDERDGDYCSHDDETGDSFH